MKYPTHIVQFVDFYISRATLNITWLSSLWFVFFLHYLCTC